MPGFEANDYTALRDRENRIYEAAGAPLPGLVIPNLIVAVVVVGILIVPAVILGILTNPLVGLLAGCFVLIAGAGSYLAAGKIDVDGLKLKQVALVYFNYAMRQPRNISGFGADEEPDEVEWRIIMWEPRTPEWEATFEIFKNHYNSPTKNLGVQP